LEQERNGGAPSNGYVLPQIGNYEDIIKLTNKSYATVTRWVSRKKFKGGIYLGNGMFNLTRLNNYLNETGSFLKERRL
jgi:transposase